jgi:RNA polymerase sigma-70 factor (ECF subfamily)
MESAKLIAALTRMTRSLELAEESAQEAFVEALTRWQVEGIPERPGAWLMTAAKHHAIDVMRRMRTAERKQDDFALALTPPSDRAPDEDPLLIRDDVLRLMFVACHPTLSPESRSALTLRLLGGLTTENIARAFLVPAATVAQRITRAKRTLAEQRIAFELPESADLTERLTSVLEVLYLIFNEGYLPTAGESWTRPELCHEALRLGRMLADLVTSDAEVHGLVALMEIQASRLNARSRADGTPILLLEQDRTTWDLVHMQRGLDALEKAETLAAETGRGPYTLQGAIAACHARAKVAADTEWKRIADLYGELVRVTGSPIAALNRSVAVAMAYGPEAGLEALEPYAEHPSLRTYPALPAVRADFLAKLGRAHEAERELLRAAELTHNASERALYRERAHRFSVQNAE